MSKGSPSMVALLGLLAVAGYQNREKIVSMVQGANAPNNLEPISHMPTDDETIYMPDTGPGAGVIDGLRKMLAGGGLAAGLSELVGRFTGPVQSARAQSWVGTGPNSEIGPDDLNEILDEETLGDLAQRTGLTRSELLTRLSAALPEAVNRLTPQGRMPTDAEAGALI